MKAPFAVIAVLLACGGAFAQTEPMSIVVKITSPTIDGLYRPDTPWVARQTAIQVVELLNKTPPFKCWGLTTETAAEQFTFTIYDNKSKIPHVRAELVAGQFQEEWDEPLIEPGQNKVVTLPPRSKDAPSPLADLVKERVLNSHMADIRKWGLAKIPLSTRPPQWSTHFPNAVVLPIQYANDGLESLVGRMRFRVSCKYAPTGDLDLFAMGRATRRDDYKASRLTKYVAYVAVGLDVDDGAGPIPIGQWKGQLGAVKPDILYFNEIGGSDAAASNH